MWIAHFVAEKRLFLYRFDGNNNFKKGDFYVGSTLTAMFPCTHPDNNRAAEVLEFIMAATRALLEGENAHPRGQIGSLKTHRRVQILQVGL